jgi:hypothetical protein
MSKNKTNLLTQAGRQHLNISTTLAMSVVMASSSAVYAAVLPQINLPGIRQINGLLRVDFLTDTAD